MTWTRARAHRVQGHFEHTGQALTERATTDRWRARLRAHHALELVHMARFDEALRTAEQAQADGELAGDRVAVGWALYASSVVHAHYHADNAAALTTLERAIAVLGDEAEATDLRVLLLFNRATALWNLGRQPEAVPVIGQALTLAERAGTPSVLATLRVVSAECCLLYGRWDEAMVELEAAATDLPPDNPSRMNLRGLIALIAGHRDDQTTMRTHLRGAEDVWIPAGYCLANYLFIARGLAAERDGQPEQALAVLLEILDPESTPEAKRVPLPVTLAAGQHCRGLVEADPTLLLSAADALDRIGYPLFRGHALENAAVLLAQGGDPVAARAAFTQAWQIYTDLDAAWDIRRADARLRPLGIRRGVRGRRRHRPTTGWAALTPTESKIAYLVAAGKSNPDIAAELYLSRNTVQTHVSHILTKLECRSRIDVAIQTMNKR